MAHNCPNTRAETCPYPNICRRECVDSFDGENCFEHRGDRWVWSGSEHSVEFVARPGQLR